ncbi:hypothetical protein EV702DRAFT_1137654 [Suillus placidus]|uniref:F-box domain-containing protein n=1 Tax=Suillus placidus TaxID=48579 RepID=A0A9P6ZN62_9AGAM|nr:hypothetical protein EV702DRAFT_1137654 [Suillus placidus]
MSDLETPYSQLRFPPTNYCAIELKDQSISDIVAERQQQLDAISAEISSLEAITGGIKNLQSQLVKQKNEIINSINLHNRLRSALWHLPTEILSQIFHHCLPQFNELPRPSQLKAPMLLTSICRRWREVAEGIPSLWCRLSVTVDDYHWQRVVFCYDSFLKRSRGLPLSVVLECTKSHSTKLRNLLQPYINQISSLSINFPQNQAPDQPELLLEDLPALQELSINRIPSPAIIQCISRLPSTLSSLRFISTCFLLEGLSYLTPVWAHLTIVDIKVHDQNTFLRLLQLCPNLSSLTTAIALASHEIQAWRPFTHTKLQFFIVSGALGYKSPLSGVFSALSLPNLRAFGSHSPSAWPHEEFKAFLTRSKCPLEALLVGCGLTAEQRADYAALVRSSKVTRSQAS